MLGIRTRGLTKRYPPTRELGAFWRRGDAEEVTALAGVDLDLEPGRLYGLVGPNGAGKTTLLKILAGLVLPTDGTLELDGAPLHARSERVRELVGTVVSDERSFHWRLSVRENLRFFATLERISDREGRVREVLEEVGLADRSGQLFRTLSTGMRQRVALARGLLAAPRVLLMDEATRSLDPLAAEELRQLVARLFPRGSDRTLVWSTHNLSEIDALCTDLVVLREGRVVARRDLVASGGALPATGGSWSLRTRLPLVPELFEREGLRVLRVTTGGAAFEVSRPEALDELIAEVARRDLGLVELRPDPWIADLFAEDTGEGAR